MKAGLLWATARRSMLGLPWGRGSWGGRQREAREGGPREVIVSDSVSPAWLLPAALCAFGAALRLWQYGADASLWADEANIR